MKKPARSKAKPAKKIKDLNSKKNPKGGPDTMGRPSISAVVVPRVPR